MSYLCYVFAASRGEAVRAAHECNPGEVQGAAAGVQSRQNGAAQGQDGEGFVLGFGKDVQQA